MEAVMLLPFQGPGPWLPICISSHLRARTAQMSAPCVSHTLHSPCLLQVQVCWVSVRVGEAFRQPQAHRRFEAVRRGPAANTWPGAWLSLGAGCSCRCVLARSLGGAAHRGNINRCILVPLHEKWLR
jgi:hypothetical protein